MLIASLLTSVLLVSQAVAAPLHNAQLQTRASSVTPVSPAGGVHVPISPSSAASSPGGVSVGSSPPSSPAPAVQPVTQSTDTTKPKLSLAIPSNTPATPPQEVLPGGKDEASAPTKPGTTDQSTQPPSKPAMTDSETQTTSNPAGVGQTAQSKPTYASTGTQTSPTTSPTGKLILDSLQILREFDFGEDTFLVKAHVTDSRYKPLIATQINRDAPAETNNVDFAKTENVMLELAFDDPSLTLYIIPFGNEAGTIRISRKFKDGKETEAEAKVQMGSLFEKGKDSRVISGSPTSSMGSGSPGGSPSPGGAVRPP